MMESEKGHSMWDVFEHILLFISLYVFATSFTLLLHTFVDRWVPPASGAYNSYRAMSSYTGTLMRGYLAAIIVSYPLFAFLFLRVAKNTFANSELRKIKARKTMIYLTLIITFIISLINFISIVYNFLGGNVSFNFLLHFLTTFGVSSLIFLYYLGQVKGDRQVYV